MRACLAGLVLWVLALPAWGSVGKVTALEGQATRTPDHGSPVALAEGADIEQMDTLQVQSGELEITLADDSVLALSAGSELQLTQAVFQPHERSVFAFLRAGSLWTSVRKALEGEQSRFQVSTERAIAGVRGTVFRVDVADAPDAPGETEVSVEEGLVQVDPREPEPASAPGSAAGAPASHLLGPASAIRVGLHRFAAAAFRTLDGPFERFIARRRDRALRLRLGHPALPAPKSLEHQRERLERRRERRQRLQP